MNADGTKGEEYFWKAVSVDFALGPHPCSVCGESTFEKGGSYDICPRCGWEDDPVQAAEPDLRGGANNESLNGARAWWRDNPWYREGKPPPNWRKWIRVDDSNPIGANAAVAQPLDVRTTNISTADDLSGFLRSLAAEFRQSPQDWSNFSLDAYLEAAAAWLDDRDAYYRDPNLAKSDELQWRVFANALLAARSRK